MRIAIQIQPWWAPLDVAQQRMLHCIQGESAKLNSLPHGLTDFCQREGFQQAQHLHELSFAALGKTCF